VSAITSQKGVVVSFDLRDDGCRKTRVCFFERHGDEDPSRCNGKDSRCRRGCISKSAAGRQSGMPISRLLKAAEITMSAKLAGDRATSA